MEWFKHSTGSHDDPDYSDAWDKFGDSAPVVFWTILEIYGAEFSHLKEGNLTVSKKYLERKLRRKWRTIEGILNYFQTRSRFFLTFTDDLTVSIKIPKFIELSSNWTKRYSKQPTEAPTEAPTAKEVYKEEVDKDKDIKKEIKKEKSYSSEAHAYRLSSGNGNGNENINENRFKRFWSVYPKKKSKGQAEKAWSKINPSEQLLETIISKIEQAKTSQDWLKDNGQYIPYPATWLNAKGWEDEYTQVPSKLTNLSPEDLAQIEKIKRMMP